MELLPEVCPPFCSRSSPSVQPPRSPNLAVRIEKNQKNGAASAGGHYSVSPHAPNSPENNVCELVEYRGAKVASFVVCGRPMICLPQAFDLFLKHLVGGLHTVYTKLKRLEIAPVVCNVEQVRILRGLGAIQPGVNRCKLLAPHEFDVLYDDCTTSSARPGRPPKRTSACGEGGAPAAAAAAAVDVPSKLQCRRASFDEMYSRRLEEFKHTAALTAAYQRCSQQSLVSAAAAAAAAAARLPPFVATPYHPALIQQAAMSMAFSNRFGRLSRPWSAGAESLSEDEVDSSGLHGRCLEESASSASSSSQCVSSDKECDGNDGSADCHPQNQSPSGQESRVETTDVECRSSEVPSHVKASRAGTVAVDTPAASRHKDKAKGGSISDQPPIATIQLPSSCEVTGRSSTAGLLEAFDQHKHQLLAELDELRDTLVAESRARDALEKKLDNVARERELFRKKYEQERECREYLELVLRRQNDHEGGNRLSTQAQHISERIICHQLQSNDLLSGNSKQL